MKVPILSAKPGKSLVRMIEHKVVKHYCYSNVTVTDQSPSEELLQMIQYTEKDHILADRLIDIIFSTKKRNFWRRKQ